MSGALPTVVACDLAKSFVMQAETIAAVAGASFELHHGEFVCLMGASGCGKSTLLHLLAGIEHPDGGQIILGGEEVTSLTATEWARLRLTSIGLVFQDDNLIDEFTAVENVALPLEAQGRTPKQARDLAMAALDRVGIAELAERRPTTLSGGQRQRVGIARAIVGDRSILLADEPTGALDSVNSQLLYGILRSLADTGVTVLVVTHDRAAEEYADRRLTMRDGRVSESVPREPSNR